jgi:hypothetical protein
MEHRIVVKFEKFGMRGIWKGGNLYMSFENEQYENIHEAYGSVELYAIYKVLIFFVYTIKKKLIPTDRP